MLGTVAVGVLMGCPHSRPQACPVPCPCRMDSRWAVPKAMLRLCRLPCPYSTDSKVTLDLEGCENELEYPVSLADSVCPQEAS